MLPQIRSLLFAGKSDTCSTNLLAAPDVEENGDWNAVHLNQDCMYKHSIMRINYTMYNVRRNEDVIHSDTTHCNVMVLDPTTSSEHSFWYARVLGIFHANVIYTAEGMDDFHPQRLEFLWVR